ncbi:glycosyltransferase family 4 protein [Acinetobacter sp. YH01012]|uniref:glycosyltransferase family 4 protein n=1 Tax=Acinetobacter sp. YH01012 TaxID=2601028 RepID=UPI0015D309F6|nr:glycosyltransferase family 4 protein [Acinetobacter sp. YH01012]
MKSFLMISSFLPSVLNLRGKLLDDIQNKGYEIHIIAPNLEESTSDLKRLESRGYKVHEAFIQRTGTNPVADVKTLFSLYKIIRFVRPDYVLAYTIKPVIYGLLAAWLAKVPYRFALIPGIGYAFQNVDQGTSRTFFQKAVHLLYKQALSHTNKVFFQNPDDYNLFNSLKLIGKSTFPIIVNGSGVHVDEFPLVELPRNNKGDLKISFLLIARLLGDKGIREYAEAAKIIRNSYPDVDFHLVGWIDTNPTAITKRELDTWIKENTITYWGKLDDVRPVIAQSSVYVLPSYREGTPRTVLEAMSMGRAIITTDAPGCRETVVHGENGFLVEVKSVQSLVEAMKQLIEKPELIDKMGKSSREIVLNKYDVRLVNNHMIKEMGL